MEPFAVLVDLSGYQGSEDPVWDVQCTPGFDGVAGYYLERAEAEGLSDHWVLETPDLELRDLAIEILSGYAGVRCFVVPSEA